MPAASSTQSDRANTRTDCVHHLVAAQALRTPAAIAVRHGQQQLSYATLMQHADQLAGQLLQHGVKRDVPVGLCFERSVDMIVAMLAVLKAGGCYLPLDPTYPAERLHFMVADADCQLLLSHSALREHLPAGDARCLFIDEPGKPPASVCVAGITHDADQLCYVIYTSGSTGKPKGVAMEHGALVNLLRWQSEQSEQHQSALCLQFAPLSFDVSFQEIFSTLTTGGELLLVDDDVRIDAFKLASYLKSQHITRLFLPFIALQQLAHAIAGGADVPKSLREVITAGEQLQITPDIQALFTALPDCSLCNQYGPSETHVVTSWTLSGPVDSWTRLPPIGKPIDGVTTHVLDSRQKSVAAGKEGELHIGGVALARGYLHREGLTRERFKQCQVSNGTERLYATGDLVKQDTHGVIHYLGRMDGQVKIRGHRIETGEVEVVLGEYPGISLCVVAVSGEQVDQKRLIAYFTAEQGAELSVTAMRQFIEQRLPDYMVPSLFQQLTDIPRTPSGKVDRQQLPAPANHRPHLQKTLVVAESEVQTELAHAWSQALQIDDIGIHDSFFELGGTSVLALRVVALLRQSGQTSLSVVDFFTHPTVAQQAVFLTDHNEACNANEAPTLHASSDSASATTETKADAEEVSGDAFDGVAVIGMAGRFPGAKDIDSYWENLRNGRESIRFFSQEELQATVSSELLNDPAYVRARGVIDHADSFDAAFFSINPREAEVLDPQQRVFLEESWHALEDAGIRLDDEQLNIGVFAGVGNNSYYHRNVLSRPDVLELLGDFQAMAANEKDYVATRVAHKLDLHGPATSIHTACSTSLVAIAEAYYALKAGRCRVALAGGASVQSPIAAGHRYDEGGILSADGHCRAFDAEATGTVFSDGVGVVVLKRLADAIADGDTIHAVLLGAATNNDGANKMSFMAPSVDGQANVVRLAHREANISARSISYVEAHGTATPIGDPIEINALQRAFAHSTSATGFCAIGSVKSNLGHLTAAAGVAGFIKTCLALKHAQIPPSLHFDTPNANIDFSSTPFYVADKLKAWSAGEFPRRAGVSAFGVGGTNAHVVLQEAPAVAKTNSDAHQQVDAKSHGKHLLLLSAKSGNALQAYVDVLANSLSDKPVNLADIAFTLQTARTPLSHRAYRLVDGDQPVAAQIQTPANTPTHSSNMKSATPRVAFMFPGQGSQYVFMGHNLYTSEPVFREAMDTCFGLLNEQHKLDLQSVMYPPVNRLDTAADKLAQTQYTQPALFSLGYALAKLWASWGIQPSALIGHSIGEYVAACVAGVFSLPDALSLVAKRGQIMQALPSGSMLSVRLACEQLRTLLPATCSIAAVNGPALCVASGPTDDVMILQHQLESRDIVCRALNTSHAFHSPMMDPIVTPFANHVAEVSRSAPTIPIVSTALNDWLLDEVATSPQYWANHLRQPVRFAEGIKTLWQQQDYVLLELGPRATACTLARQQITRPESQVVIPCLADTADANREIETLFNAVGKLWLTGVEVDGQQFHQQQFRQKAPLPGYVFQRKRFWLKPGKVTAEPPSADSPVALTPETDNIQHPSGKLMNTDNTARQEQQQNDPARSQRTDILQEELRELFEETSGMDLSAATATTTFFEMGLDSLFLTQAGATVKRKFSVKVSFRQLQEDFPTLGLLAAHLDQVLPAEPDTITSETKVESTVPIAPAGQVALTERDEPIEPVANTGRVASTQSAALTEGVGPAECTAPAEPGAVADQAALTAIATSAPAPHQGALAALIAQQVQLMSQQLQLLQTSSASPNQAPCTNALADKPGTQLSDTSPSVRATAPVISTLVPMPGAEKAITTATSTASVPGTAVDKPFGAQTRIARGSGKAIGTGDQQALQKFIGSYNQRTAGSKHYAQQHRRYFSDPRTVSGFTPQLKELVYPIVVERSSGSRLWDVDNNEYIDLANGFGSNFLGHSNDRITEALHRQLDRGVEIGPQTPLAGEVARMFCDMTGHERAAFCNTGSEAVLGAMRIARTVTGNDLIVCFKDDYHGIFDEVIVRPAASGKSLPAAPGIPADSVNNILVLDYDDKESLHIIRERADDIAGVLVEPVQSRHPGLQPQEFLQALRQLATELGVPLIMDEVITGFRIHPGGAQAYFGVQGDMATYGKIVGGGMPIGVIAGSANYMDALDGGHWQYGDASFPEAGVTYFAGTFVRHPLAMAAAKATLQHLQQQGPELQQQLNRKSTDMVQNLNTLFAEYGSLWHIENFGSLFKLQNRSKGIASDLLCYWLRHNGLHIWDGRPCFLTTAHTDADIIEIQAAFRRTLEAMEVAGLLGSSTPDASASTDDLIHRADQPPVVNARLGTTESGEPAWFVPGIDDTDTYQFYKLA